MDSVTSSRLANNSTTILLELSGEIKEASSKKGFPAKKLRRMMKAFDVLRAFCERVLELHRERFGDEDSLDEDESPGAAEEAAFLDVLREAESNVVPFRRKA